MAKTPAKTAAKPPATISAVETALVMGDLSQLSPTQRLELYKETCESTGLNPVTQPFDYITLKGKLKLYCKSEGADQLRTIRRISITSLERIHHQETGLFSVTAKAKDDKDRIDEAVGIVNVAGLNGENLANAMMKCETKAKRRVTLSICGLSFLDADSLAFMGDKEDAELVDVTPQPAAAELLSPPRAEDPGPPEPEPEPAPADHSVDDQPPEPGGHDPGEPDKPEYITERDRRRLFALAKECWPKAKDPNASLKILIKTHGFTSTKKISYAAYQAIVEALEQGAGSSASTG